MKIQRVETMKEVRVTFASWKDVSEKIERVKAALADHDPDRDKPVADLQAELRVLHHESERLLLIAQNALLKIKTPRSSNGDSTWG